MIAGLVAYTTLSLLGVAFVAIIAVTLFYNFPSDTIIWAIVVLVYQQIENNVPRRSCTAAPSRCRGCW